MKHTVAWNTDVQLFGCGCERWTKGKFQRQDCKHVIYILNEFNPSRRTKGVDLPDGVTFMVGTTESSIGTLVLTHLANRKAGRVFDQQAPIVQPAAKPAGPKPKAGAKTAFDQEAAWQRLRAKRKKDAPWGGPSKK